MPTSSTERLDPLDPHFLEKICVTMAERGSLDGLAMMLDLQGEYRLALATEEGGLQDAVLFRARRRAQRIATWLISDHGKVDMHRLDTLLGTWRTSGHIAYANGAGDYEIHVHIARILQHLHEDPHLIAALEHFQLPLCHSYAESLIRSAMTLSDTHSLHVSDVRRAVLSACLTYLRQRVGSCFATAPAIHIQHGQLSYMFRDLHELLHTGRLTRVHEGVEHAVPLSPNWGIGDLRRDILAVARRHPVWQSPGLVMAAHVAGILSHYASLKKAIEQLQKNYTTLSVSHFFEELLCEQYDIAPAHLRNFREQNLLSSYHLLVGNPRYVDCVKIETALQTAQGVFCAFVDHPLLKAWEFTLASLAESKSEFSSWNLYTSLGLDPQAPGGIGEVVATHINDSISSCRTEVEQLDRQYQLAYDQVRGTEALFRRVETPAQARRLKAEHTSRLYHMRALLDMRDEAHARNNKFAHLYPYLVQQYLRLFPEFFQEIYDAEMGAAEGGAMYEDSMAGFRLVYKHGRKDPSQWTMIYTPGQYVQALIDFFRMTENPILAACEYAEIADEIKRVTDCIIIYLRTDQFLQSALHRSAQAHASKHLAAVGGLATPWAYVSGGTIETLLKTYYSRSADLSTEVLSVETEEELLLLILDTLKHCPWERVQGSGWRALLMNSPNHAFLLLPDLAVLRRGWEDTGFTYTWVRDHVVAYGKNFFSQIQLSRDEQVLFVAKCSEREHVRVRERILHSCASLPNTVSLDSLIAAMMQGENTQRVRDHLDAVCTFCLPFIPADVWKERVLHMIPANDQERVRAELNPFPNVLERPIFAEEFLRIVKGIYLLATGCLQSGVDLHMFTAQLHRELLGVPSPVLFADSNWPHYYLAFGWGACSGRLRLWRMNRSGTSGIPMGEWDEFFHTGTPRPWPIFIRPEQYA